MGRCLVSVAYGEKYERMSDQMISSFLKHNNGWDVERVYGNAIRVPSGCAKGGITAFNACEIGRWVAIRELLDKYDEVLYCDGDMMWYGEYEPLDGDVVLSPHHVTDKAKYEARYNIYQDGSMNAGLVYMRRSENARNACDYVTSYVSAVPGRFIYGETASYVDRVGKMWLQPLESCLLSIGIGNVVVDERPGCNAAFWNTLLHRERRIVDIAGRHFVECGGIMSPLVCFHFSAGNKQPYSMGGDELDALWNGYRKYIESDDMEMNKVYGVKSWRQIGDQLVLSGAVRNVKAAHPEISFMYVGHEYYKPLFDGNADFVDGAPSCQELPTICYGNGEKIGARGNHIEAQTRTLCERIGIPMVEISTRTPVVTLTDDEMEWGRQFQGKWLVNANFQTVSVSKHYPHWQEVVDGMNALGLSVVQVGGREQRDITTDLKGVDDWRGRTTLRQWLSMVCNCAGIVTPPSGILHAGAIWNKPMVVICGAREIPEITGYPTARYVTSECEHIGCEAQKSSQCRRYGNDICPCMDINPVVVLSNIGQLSSWM